MASLPQGGSRCCRLSEKAQSLYKQIIHSRFAADRCGIQGCLSQGLEHFPSAAYITLNMLNISAAPPIASDTQLTNPGRVAVPDGRKLYCQ
jgi:hypothetical protein